MSKNYQEELQKLYDVEESIYEILNLNVNIDDYTTEQELCAINSDLFNYEYTTSIDIFNNIEDKESFIEHVKCLLNDECYDYIEMLNARIEDEKYFYNDYNSTSIKLKLVKIEKLKNIKENIAGDMQ